MCLSAKQVIKWLGSEKALVKRAHKDIIVYKVLEKIRDTYYAPYRSYIYHEGLNIPQNPSKKRLFEKIAIHGGWLHAFIDRENAENMGEWSANKFVIQMTIPKGARYIVGRDGDVCASCLKWE